MKTVLVAGNPNSGKTTLFNLLTGARARVGNYPGITVDRRSGPLELPGGIETTLVDLPGTYSLTASSREEQIAADALFAMGDEGRDLVVVVVDATTLRRQLYLALQILELDIPVVIALNMMDEARAQGVEIDVDRLSKELGAPVVPLAAAKGEGKAALLDALKETLAEAPPRELRAPSVDSEALEQAVAKAMPDRSERDHAAYASWAWLSLGDDELEGVPEAVRQAVRQAHADENDGARSFDAIIAERYARVDAAVESAVTRPESSEASGSERVDRVLTHPVMGFVVFAAVMLLIFQMLFAWSDPLIGLVEDGVAMAQTLVGSWMPEGAIRSLVVDGIVAGVGNVLVFVPQIALLFLFIGFLEDSGYLARVAFLIDRVMGGVGLHGKAFVPMLSGFACAIPAVMATRTIESRRDRLLTMMVVPLMSCSARLPVYVLVTATVFAAGTTVFGISIGAVVLLAMYTLSVVAALLAAAVLRRTLLKGPRPKLVLELPPYRWPNWRTLLLSTWHRVRSFLIDAGTIILALTIVIWAALSYPKNESEIRRFEGLREAAAAIADDTQREEELAAIDNEEAQGAIRDSIAGKLGKAIEPVIEPLGYDWRLGVGIVGAFAAREVFVSTLGIVFGVGEADEESTPLRDQLRNAKNKDGSPLLTPLVGVSLMVFFVLAAQCMSTIAVIKREANSWRWAGFMFVYMTVLAYVAALLVFQVGRAMGWGTG